MRQQPLTPGSVRVHTWYSGISAGTELTAYRGSNPYLTGTWDLEPPAVPRGRADLRLPRRGLGVLRGRPGRRGRRRGRGAGRRRRRARHLGTPQRRGAARGGRGPPGVDGRRHPRGHLRARRVHRAQRGARGGDAGGRPAGGVRPGRHRPARHPARHAQRRRRGRRRHAGPTAGDGSCDGRRRDRRGRRRGRCRCRRPCVVRRRGRRSDRAERQRPGSARGGRSVVVDGTVVASGFYQGGAANLRLGEEFHHNRVRIVASQIGGTPVALGPRWDQPRLVRTFMEPVRRGRVDAASLVTDVVDAADVAAVFERLDRGDPDILQAVLRFSAAPTAMTDLSLDTGPRFPADRGGVAILGCGRSPSRPTCRRTSSTASASRACGAGRRRRLRQSGSGSRSSAGSTPPPRTCSPTRRSGTSTWPPARRGGSRGWRRR